MNYGELMIKINYNFGVPHRFLEFVLRGQINKQLIGAYIGDKLAYPRKLRLPGENPSRFKHHPA
jgi:hypothetical protein